MRRDYLLLQVRRSALGQDWDTAIEAVELVFEVAPTWDKPWGWKAFLLAITGQAEEANAAADRCLDLNSKNVHAWWAKASLADRSGSSDDAADFAAKATQSDRIDPAELRLLGAPGWRLQVEGYYRQEKLDLALEAADEYVKGVPSDPLSWEWKSEIHEKLDQSHSVLATLESGRQATGDSSRLALRYYEALLIDGQLQEAIEYAIDRFTKIEEGAECWLCRVAALQLRGKHDEVVEATDKAIEAFESKGNFMSLKAISLLMLGDQSNAATTAKKATSENGDSRKWIAHCLLAFVQSRPTECLHIIWDARQQDEDCADDILLDVIEVAVASTLSLHHLVIDASGRVLASDDLGMLSVVGSILLNFSPKWYQAIGVDMSRVNNPMTVDCIVVLSRAKSLDAFGKTTAAIDAINDGMRRFAEHSQMRALLAQLLIKTGKLKEAHKEATAATVLSPNSGQAWATLGLASHLRNTPKAADAAFRKALSVDPTCSDIYFYEAMVNEKRKKPRLAVSRLDAGLDIDPKDWRLWALKAKILHDHANDFSSEPAYVPECNIARGMLVSNYLLHREAVLNKAVGTVLSKTNALPLLEKQLAKTHKLHRGIEGAKRQMELGSTLEAAEAAIFWIQSNECDWIKPTKLFQVGKLALAYGNPVLAYQSFDELDQYDDELIQTQAYWLWSAQACLDTDPSIADNALSVARSVAASDTATAYDFYYAGHVFLACDELEEASSAFRRAPNFVPAVYMTYLVAKRLNAADCDQCFARVLNSESAEIEAGGYGLLLQSVADLSDIDDEHTGGYSSSLLEESVVRFEIDAAIQAVFDQLEKSHDTADHPAVGRFLAAVSIQNEFQAVRYAPFVDWVQSWPNSKSSKQFAVSIRRMLADQWLAANETKVDGWLAVVGIDQSLLASGGSDPAELLRERQQAGLYCAQQIGSSILRTDLRRTKIRFADVIRFCFFKKMIPPTIALALVSYLQLKRRHDCGLLALPANVSPTDVVGTIIATQLATSQLALAGASFPLVYKVSRLLTKSFVKFLDPNSKDFPTFQQFIAELENESSATGAFSILHEK